MAMNQNAAIGMLDSGLGGLTVLQEAVRRLPAEHFIYYADFQHSPFGGRSKPEMVGILKTVVADLMRRNIKALVLASNTATSAAVEVLRSDLPIPVIGLEPALKPAVEATPEGKILVLATELTLKEEKFRRLYESYRDRGDIILQSCPGLVELIDAGRDHHEVGAYLDRLFAPLDRAAVRTVVLGCTHYVIIRRDILDRFLPGTLGLDGNEGVARHLADVLSRLGGLAGGPGRVELLSSDPAKTAWLEQQYQKLASAARE